METVQGSLAPEAKGVLLLPYEDLLMFQMVKMLKSNILISDLKLELLLLDQTRWKCMKRNSGLHPVS